MSAVAKSERKKPPYPYSRDSEQGVDIPYRALRRMGARRGSSSPALPSETIALAVELVRATSPPSQDRTASTYRLPDGEYTGEVNAQEEPHGQGKLHYQEGDQYHRLQYEGSFVNGWLEGHGKMTWRDGKVYSGEWKASKKHGSGQEKYATGGQYEGQFQEDKKHGIGTMCYSDGSRYVGAFVQDKRKGQGTYTESKDNIQDSKVYKGSWENDTYEGEGQLVNNHSTTSGIISFTYTGTFKDGKFWRGREHKSTTTWSCCDTPYIDGKEACQCCCASCSCCGGRCGDGWNCCGCM